ncbi:MAG: hypothetical protein RIG84_16630 [Roseovarius sp.]
MRSNTAVTPTILLLSAAVIANGCAGLLYVLSLFILPIETALGLSRADLGFISSLALISFTSGVCVLPLLVARVGRVPAAALAFALIGGGHIAFGLDPSWRALVLGYGIGFGAGSGLAYGFALSLAAALDARFRAISIGLALGAFALSGILLPILLGDWILSTPPGAAFLSIGWTTLGVGLVCVLALVAAARPAPATGETEPPKPTAPSMDSPFALLFLIFFLICFIGLAIVSQAAAVAAAAGIMPAGYAATALTLGYLGGSLLGAPLAERLGETKILLSLGCLAVLGSLLLLTKHPLPLFSGAAIVGMTFGGSGSVVPVLLGMRYGAENISRLYGRAIIAYGLAGFLAPTVAGLLFDHAESYAPLLALCAFFGLLVLIATIFLVKLAKPSAGSDLV